MNSNRFSAVLLLAMLCTPSLLAQETKPNPAPATKPTPVFNSPASSTRVAPEVGYISLDFPGGTVAQYVDALRTAAGPGPANIMVDSEAAPLKVPAARLSRTSLENSLLVMERTVSGTNDRHANVGIHLERLYPNSPDAAPIFVVQASYPLGHGDPPPSRTMVVLSLNPIVGLPGTKSEQKVDAKAVLSAVEAAVMVAETATKDAPTMKFHETSGLLFVRGTPAQLRAAEDVINQLRKDVDQGGKNAAAENESRAESKIAVHPDRRTAVLESLRKHFEDQCCVQFRLEGDASIVLTGDRHLVNEAAQWASLVETSLLQNRGTPK